MCIYTDLINRSIIHGFSYFVVTHLFLESEVKDVLAQWLVLGVVQRLHVFVR